MANYIIRLDDACPTMNTKQWDRIESLLDKYKIKPVVAVIPHNEDISMFKENEDIYFWEKVNRWKKKGWLIALHGYNHVYCTEGAGLVPFNKRSEFAGLSYEKQAKKIKEGIKIFNQNNIDTNIWVAPSHSFDLDTIKALKNYSNINIINDGIAIFPFERYGLKWIPQQFWLFRKMPFGVWTSCFHPNNMTDKEFEKLESFLKKNNKDFLGIEKLKFKKFCLLNDIFEFIYWQLRKVRKWILH